MKIIVLRNMNVLPENSKSKKIQNVVDQTGSPA